jgi:hypothetical protein
MDTSEIGFWMMLAFWATAAGSIAFGISWARMKGRDENLIRDVSHEKNG